MHLVPDDKLIWSPVVANSRMNRERNASGINSYEQELKFKPETFLYERIESYGQAAWLDLCCGQGKALVQVGDYFSKQNLASQTQLWGIDLIGDFVDASVLDFIHLKIGTIADFNSELKYDLITCVHGLHYVGDKLQAIEKAVGLLKPEGLFWANLDLGNIHVQDHDSTKYLKALFQKSGLDYNSRTKVIKSIGFKSVAFGLKYLGADDQYGPNYTGQPSVCSHYSAL